MCKKLFFVLLLSFGLSVSAQMSPNDLPSAKKVESMVSQGDASTSDARAAAAMKHMQDLVYALDYKKENKLNPQESKLNKDYEAIYDKLVRKYIGLPGTEETMRMMTQLRNNKSFRDEIFQKFMNNQQLETYKASLDAPIVLQQQPSVQNSDEPLSTDSGGTFDKFLSLQWDLVAWIIILVIVLGTIFIRNARRKPVVYVPLKFAVKKGVVDDEKKNYETIVTSSGGGGTAQDIKPVRVSSRSVIHQDIVLADNATETIHFIRIQNWNFPISHGDRIVALTDASNTDYYYAIHNEKLNITYYSHSIGQKSTTTESYATSCMITLFIWIALYYIIKMVNGDQVTSFAIASVLAAVLLAVIQMATGKKGGISQPIYDQYKKQIDDAIAQEK